MNTKRYCLVFIKAVTIFSNMDFIAYLVSKKIDPVTFKNAKTPKMVATQVPLESLLIETDSPYLTPVPFRGKRNDPTKVRYVAETIANLREISYQRLVEATNKNTKKLFNIPE